MIRWKDGKVDRDKLYSRDVTPALSELADALDVAVAALRNIDFAPHRDIAKDIAYGALLEIGADHASD